MKAYLLVFASALFLFTSSSGGIAVADEKDGASSSGQVRVEDLPKPIPELLDKLKHLSAQIEPEITKLGSRLGSELDETVKKLERELKKRRQSDQAR